VSTSRSTARFNALRTLTSSNGTARIAGGELPEKNRRWLAEHQVGPAFQDLAHLAPVVDVELPDDPVREAVWPRSRPLPEGWVSSKHELIVLRVPHDHVRPGRWDRRCNCKVSCSPGGNGESERQGEPVQEIGVGSNEVERDGIRSTIRDDPTRQIALLGSTLTGRGALDGRVMEGTVASQPEDARARDGSRRGARAGRRKYRRPGRNWNVYFLPPSVALGSDLARSGTSVAPSSPPTRLNPTSPSFVSARMFQESEKYASPGSSVSSTLLEETVSVPPR
jgi:hypothetical protein